MKSAKTLHTIEALLLLLITAAVLFGVASSQKSFFKDLLPFRSLWGEDSTEAEATASDDAEQSTEEWSIPEISIDYDDFVASEIEQDNFINTVVIGNSQAQALSNYGLLKKADFVTRIGLSINKVLVSSTGNAPIADLYGKRYSKAVFVFGENELGWPYPKNFISEYKKVIAKVRELNPGIKIYCQSVFPVTAEHSEKDVNGVTNDNVTLFNTAIEEMCDEIGATFIPASEAFYADHGALPEDAAKDGVHFNYDYCKIWAGDMSAYLDEDGEETIEVTETVESTTELTTDIPDVLSITE